MKKYAAALTLFNLLVLIGFYFLLKPAPQSENLQVAVIDLSPVVANSAKMQALNAEYNQKLDELEKWIDNSQKEIQREKKKEKKTDLIRQYQDIAMQKKEIIKQNYENRMSVIEKEILQTIKTVAGQKKCSLILYRSAVSQGGTDITDEVIKSLPLQ